MLASFDSCVALKTLLTPDSRHVAGGAIFVLPFSPTPPETGDLVELCLDRSRHDTGRLAGASTMDGTGGRIAGAVLRIITLPTLQ